MNQEQYARWRDFALRMARTCWTNRQRPKRDWIVEAVEDFFAGLEDWELIETWENSADFPEGHRYYRVTYDGLCYCQFHGNVRERQAACVYCKGTGRRFDVSHRSLLCDDVTCWADEYIDEQRLMTQREWKRFERLRHDDDCDEADAIQDAIRELYLSPVSCCIRAGFDCAVSPSMGVVGFTAGDLRRMYPKGVPDWVKNGDWETIGVSKVAPGIGFVPEPKGDFHPFDAIPDEASVWI